MAVRFLTTSGKEGGIRIKKTASYDSRSNEKKRWGNATDVEERAEILSKMILDLRYYKGFANKGTLTGIRKKEVLPLGNDAIKKG